MQGEKNSRKNKWRNKCRKNIIGLKKVKSKIINKRGKQWKKEKREKKENSSELQKPNVEAEFYNNNIKFDWMYIYTYTPISKIKTVQQKLNTIFWPGEQRKPKIIYQNKTN